MAKGSREMYRILLMLLLDRFLCISSFYSSIGGSCCVRQHVNFMCESNVGGLRVQLQARKRTGVPNGSSCTAVSTDDTIFVRHAKAYLRPQLKLPVWPVYGGVLAQLLDWLGLYSASDQVLSAIGGRVVPMPLNDLEVSPFLLLVHHTHSFMPLDPIRPITNLILPEGFPAHPHSGFGTLTFTIRSVHVAQNTDILKPQLEYKILLHLPSSNILIFSLP